MGVDLVNSTLEGSYDVAVLRALIQVMKPEHARKIMKSVFLVIEPGGYIYILGCILDNTRLSPTVLMAFSQVFFKEAGFTDISIEHGVTPDAGGVVSARKP